MKRYPFNHIENPIVTNKFRDDKYNPHYGTDYALSHRTALISPTRGVVVKVVNTESRNWIANTSSDPYKPVGFPFIKRRLRTEDYGNYVKISHGKDDKNNDITTLMAHLDDVSVYEGQEVEEGQLVGYSDSTGNSTGSHLHYEVRVNDRVIDPDKFDYNFQGKGGGKGEFYPFETTVTVRPEVDTLYVRSGPHRNMSLAGKGSKGPGKLTGGDEIHVVGFVKGERVTYGDISTQFWWESSQGNYFWSGGTNLIPTLDNYPEGIVKREDKKTMEEKLQLIEDLKVREAELENFMKEVVSKENELKGVQEELAKLEAEVLAEKEAEATPEQVVEEAVAEVVAEEAPVVEAVETVAMEEPAKDPKEELLKKFEEEVAALRAKLGL